MKSMVSAIAICLLVLLSLPATAANDWPRFRGPNGDGISPDTDLKANWPDSGPEVVFKVPLGKGFSGISAVDGRLYTVFSKKGDEFLVALDAKTGKEIWRFRTDDERPDGFGDGPRSTPYIEGDRIYVASALGKLYALELATGKTIWQHDLKQKYGAQIPTWGVSASPLIEGDLLIFNVGGKSGHAVMAFDKKTGKVAWKSGSGLPGYSNPLPMTVDGVRQVVVFAGTQVMALRPENGEILWTVPWKTSYDVNAAAPVLISPNKVFISSGYDVGAALFEVKKSGDKWKAEEVWRTRGMKNQFSSSVYHDGALFGFDDKNLKSIDAKTGEDLWRHRGLGHGSLFFVDGHLIVLGEKGKLLLIEANADAYVEKASAQPMEGKHWTVPTLHDGLLYIRNEKDLMALRVGGSSGQG